MTDLEDVLDKMHADLMALGYADMANDLIDCVYEWTLLGYWGLSSKDLPNYFDDTV